MANTLIMTEFGIVTNTIDNTIDFFSTELESSAKNVNCGCHTSRMYL